MNNAYVDDSDVTEITILPDGRLYVFGLSEKIRDVLRLLQGDPAYVDIETTGPAGVQVTCGEAGTQWDPATGRPGRGGS
jgi:hypothetical protein